MSPAKELLSKHRLRGKMLKNYSLVPLTNPVNIVFL
jgi:hypothetical protein